jgi:hypothetical protein
MYLKPGQSVNEWMYWRISIQIWTTSNCVAKRFTLHNHEIFSLTHSMVQDIIWKVDCHSACQKISCFHYGTQRFITVFTKARHWILSWASQIQFAPSIPISLRSILMLSSHLHLSLTVVSYLRTSQPKPCKHLSPPPRVPHVLSTSSFLI